MAKFFTDDEDAALNECADRELTSIEYECPYRDKPRACGSWCPLFEVSHHSRSSDGAILIQATLKCGAGTKIFKGKQGADDESGNVPFK